MRSLYLVIIALAASDAAMGQTAPSQLDPPAILQNMRHESTQVAALWLRSPEPRLQAWGAYLVLRDRLTQLSPDLLALVSSHQVVAKSHSSPDSDSHDAMVAVIDTLIQLDIKVPVSELVRLNPEFPTETLILMSRLDSNDELAEGEVSAALLHVFETEDSRSNAWLAAGNLLANREAPGFAAIVLRDMVISIEVNVTSPDSMGGIGSGMSCCGVGLEHEPRSGWPEVGTYTLFDCGTPGRVGATVLAGGKDPAYFVRTVDALYGYGDAGSCGCSVDRNLVRQHYLESLLNYNDEDIPIKSESQQGIQWHGGAAFVSALQSLVQAERSAFQGIVKELLDKDFLSSEEAGSATPKFEIKIRDMRHEDKTPFPPIPDLGADVTVSIN